MLHVLYVPFLTCNYNCNLHARKITCKAREGLDFVEVEAVRDERGALALPLQDPPPVAPGLFVLETPGTEVGGWALL